MLRKKAKIENRRCLKNEINRRELKKELHLFQISLTLTKTTVIISLSSLFWFLSLMTYQPSKVI